MRAVFLTLLCLFAVIIHAQVHFSKFNSPKYQIVKISYGVYDQTDSKIDVVDLSGIKGLKNALVQWRELTNDSSKIFIYRNSKLVQTFVLPINITMLLNGCKVADIDNNKHPDIKFTIGTTYPGLAGSQSYKVYLFNLGTRFKLISFFDFSMEDEHDLNKDGVYEIISANHVYKDNHSYWVYNAYNFSGGKLKNISASVNYPLWTKHLQRTYKVVARNIAVKERLKQFRALPDKTIIR